MSSAFQKWTADPSDPQTLPDNSKNPYHELFIYKILRIEETPLPNNRTKSEAVLNENFVRNMTKVFSGNIDQLYQKTGVPLQDQQEKEFEDKCIQGWKKLYNFIDQNSQRQQVRTIQSNNLCRVGANYSNLEQRFEFILSSTKHQLNSFLKFYTKQLEREFPGHLAQIINIIINLSMLHPTNTYILNTRQQSRLEQIIVKDFSEIELIHRRAGCNQEQINFSVSKMLHNFLIADPKIRVDLNCEIIVETNFMVYIEIKNYKETDELDEALKLVQDFINVQVVFPHMIVGELSQDKVVQAYKKGITANLIIDFFCKCCSPKRRKYVNERRAQSKKFDMQKTDGIQKKPLHFLKLFAKDYEISLVPENVVQQLQLWEKEKNIDYQAVLQKVNKMTFEENILDNVVNQSDDDD